MTWRTWIVGTIITALSCQVLTSAVWALVEHAPSIMMVR